MPTGQEIFKDLESEAQVPEYLKAALVSEVDTIRDVMQVVTHFTEHFLSALTISIAVADIENTNI